MSKIQHTLRISLLFGLCVFTGAQSAQASPSNAERPANQDFTLEVHCDPLHVEGSESGPANRRSAGDENPLGMRPPTCSLEGNQNGGNYSCTCADDTTLAGELDADAMRKLYDGQDGGFEWCAETLNKNCGPFPEPVEVECEGEHGICAVTTLARLPGQAFTDLAYECACDQEQGWRSVTESAAGFTLDRAQLQSSCEAEVARCKPAQSQAQSASVLDLPNQEVPKRMAVGCMSAKGQCQAQLTAKGLRTTCECYDSPDEGHGTESPKSPASVQELLQFCKRDLRTCEGGAQPEEPKDPAEPDQQPGAKNPGSSTDLPAIGCSVGGSGLASLWSLLLLGALGLRRRP